MALFNDNTEYKNDNHFLIVSDMYDSLLESYSYNLNITKAIHKHDINDITLTESYEKQEILREGIGDIFKTIKEKIIHLWNIVKNFFKRLFGINRDIAETNKEVAKKTEEAIRNKDMIPTEDISTNMDEFAENISNKVIANMKEYEDKHKIIVEPKDNSTKDSLNKDDINYKAKTYRVRDYMVFDTLQINNLFKVYTHIRGLDDCTVEGLTKLGKFKHIDDKSLISAVREEISTGRVKDKTMTNDEFKVALYKLLRGDNSREYSFNDMNGIQNIIDRLKHSDESFKLFKSLESETNEKFKNFLNMVDRISKDHSVNASKTYIKGEQDYLTIGCNKYTAFLHSIINLITVIVDAYTRVFNKASNDYRKICSIYTGSPWWKNSN